MNRSFSFYPKNLIGKLMIYHFTAHWTQFHVPEHIPIQVFILLGKYNFDGHVVVHSTRVFIIFSLEIIIISDKISLPWWLLTIPENAVHNLTHHSIQFRFWLVQTWFFTRFFFFLFLFSSLSKDANYKKIKSFWRSRDASKLTRISLLPYEITRPWQS